MKRRILAFSGLIVASLLLTGCVQNSENPQWSASDATVKTTDAALAEATVDYLHLPSTYSAPTEYLSHYPGGGIGADVTLRLHGKKIHVTTVISRKGSDYQVTSCDHSAPYDGCREQNVDGHKLITVWQYIEPEEDPGVIELTSFRHNEYVDVLFSGPDIKHNPFTSDLRELEIKLENLATSPVVGFMTTPSYVKQGPALHGWHTQNAG